MAKSPCNICGVEWPRHDEHCAYLHTALEHQDLKIRVTELEGDLASLAKEHSDLLAYTKELEQRLGAVLH